MACSCSHDVIKKPPTSRFRTALWIALIINASMFVVEIVGGAYTQSSALWADALDFFGDAMNYAVSLAVLGASLYWRATVALIKGLTMILFGVVVFVKVLYGYVQGIPPEAFGMGMIAVAALIANIISAWVLFAFRDGDANMQSVWLCSRNDAIGNVAVILAALAVWATGSIWPDLIVATLMAALGLSAGYQIITQAMQERRQSNSTL